MTSHFGRIVRLPAFIDGQQTEVDAVGYEYHGSSYDGFRNKVRITPLVPAIPGEWYITKPFGEDYTIGAAHLDRLIRATNTPANTSPFTVVAEAVA